MSANKPPSVAPATGPPRDLGFGGVVADQSRQRLLNPDGTFNVRRRGLPWRASLSLFNSLLGISWPRFLALVALFYLTVNALFAIGYVASGPDALAGIDASANRLAQAFFFSVQTFSTVGYGSIAPVGRAANLLMTFEALVGLLTTALVTGLVFARFSRPIARIRFSRQAVIGDFRGGRALKLRMVNLRKSQLIEVRVQVIFTWFEEATDGRHRRFQELPLERRTVTFFPLHWTLVHPIDEKSPLHRLDPASARLADAEVLVLVTAIDETFSQTVHSRSSYKAEEIEWNGDFTSIFHHSPDGPLSIDIDRMDEVEVVTGS